MVDALFLLSSWEDYLIRSSFGNASNRQPREGFAQIFWETFQLQRATHVCLLVARVSNPCPRSKTRVGNPCHKICSDQRKQSGWIRIRSSWPMDKLDSPSAPLVLAYATPGRRRPGKLITFSLAIVSMFLLVIGFPCLVFGVLFLCSAIAEFSLQGIGDAVGLLLIGLGIWSFAVWLCSRLDRVIGGI